MIGPNFGNHLDGIHAAVKALFIRDLFPQPIMPSSDTFFALIVVVFIIVVFAHIYRFWKESENEPNVLDR